MKLLRPGYFAPALHIIIWMLLLIIPSILFWNQNFFGLTHRFFFITSLYHIGFFYFNAYFLYPKLLTRKRWWLYLLSIAAILIASYQIKIYILQLNPHFNLIPQNTRIIFFAMIPFLVASIIYRLISDRILFEKKEKEAKAERLDAELKFLRSQVSPHFLFNTLTNMVSLARQKSDLLEPSLIKLSDQLRYMLYDSLEENIPVSKEIDHIVNYIELQQLRFGEDVQVTLDLNNDCPECQVEPMLLLPFIENAFKHGVGMLEKPFINIYLAVKKSLLEFKVTNNYNPANLSKDKNSGIGLVNIKNRLELSYHDNYFLLITNKDGMFSVTLNINL